MSIESSASSAEATAGLLRVLRIIVLAMAIGVTMFAGVAISLNLNKPHTIAGKFDTQGLMFLAMGIVALPLGMILPGIVFAAGRRAPAMNVPSGMTSEQGRIFGIQQRIQTTTIIACAIFEGAAFANTFAYLQSREIAHLALAGILVAGILAHFPTAGSYQRRIEDELRRMNEEDMFKRPT
jgi:hypothetical protein